MNSGNQLDSFYSIQHRVLKWQDIVFQTKGPAVPAHMVMSLNIIIITVNGIQYWMEINVVQDSKYTRKLGPSFAMILSA
jgi:hypothetical protein